MMLNAGDAAPDFEIKDNQGRTVRLSDYKGKKDVLLWFYPKADTPG
jgi:peroxiredoxin